MSSLCYKSAQELSGLIRSGDLSPVELMEETLKRIETVNPMLNAFVALRAEGAMNEAKGIAERLSSGVDPGPLAGIPVGVKDLEDVAGMVTSFGSVPFSHNMAAQDSFQVTRLKEAGAIIVGKTNTPEFGFTPFTKNRLYGVTRNPWNGELTPGGSSGGSAAAVTAGMVPLATGSDAGGSIRIPACFSGCFGLKTSSGRIPLGPVKQLYFSHNWTLGPLSRTVRDAALYLDCVAGYHPGDPSSLPPPGISYVACLDKAPSSFRIGFSPTLGYARVKKEIMLMVERAVKSFEEMGHRVDYWEGRLPDVSEAWSKLTTTEIYAQIQDNFEKIHPEMGRALVESLEGVKRLSMRDYIEFQKIRSELNRILWEFFDEYDLLLTPAMPTEAFNAKGPPPTEIEGHPIPILWAVAFTFPFNFSGHPAASVRIGLTEKGLPAGLQIVGPRYREDRVLQAAFMYEQACPWNHLWPELGSK